MFSRGARAGRRAIFRGFASSARSNVARSLIAGGVVAGVVAGTALFKQFQELADDADILERDVAHAEEKVPFVGLPGTKHERTFIAIKPDGVHRALVGEVIKRFETKGYKLVALKLVYPTQDFAAKHYDDLKSKPFFGGLIRYFSSGPVVAMVWEGRNVIVGGRKLVGATRPDDATPGTVRGDFCIDVGRNVIHGSDSADSAKAEISLWFTDKEVVSYEIEHSNKWVYEKADEQPESKVDKQREAKIAAHIVKKLIETGERDRLKEWTRMMLTEAGWKDQLKRDCLEYIKKKGKDNVSADELMDHFQPIIRVPTLTSVCLESIPPAIRAELIQKMRVFLSK